MHKMLKIYKLGILENRFSMALVAGISLLTTACLVLVLLGMRAFWPVAVLAAFFAAAVYGMFCRPYGVSSSAAKIVALLLLNLLILAACLFVS